MMRITGGNRNKVTEEEAIIDPDPIQMIQVNQVPRTEEAEKEKLEKKREVLIMGLIIPIIQNE
jgi:hypothetical protein